QWRQSVGKSFDIKPATANNDCDLAARMNFSNHAQRRAPIFFNIHLFVSRQSADQMMRSLSQCSNVRFCSEEIEPTVNLKRVGADNFRANFARNIGGQLRFPRCSWANDKERAPHQIELIESPVTLAQ